MYDYYDFNFGTAAVGSDIGKWIDPNTYVGTGFNVSAQWTSNYRRRDVGRDVCCCR